MNLDFPNDIAILVKGEFNTVVAQRENCGNIPADRQTVLDFNIFQDDAALLDIGFTGARYTWCSDNPKDLVWERLDRVLANNKARNQLNFKVVHGPRLLSDHASLICIVVIENQIKSSFKIFNMWLTHPTCLEVIQKVWNQYSSFPLLYRLQ